MNESNNTQPVLKSDTAQRPRITPAVDIFENADEYRVIADLPGVLPDHVQLDLESGALTLQASVRVEREGTPLVLGRDEGEVHRVFRIPDHVDTAKIEASFEEGVLSVRLPKSEAIRPRRVAINAPA